VKTELALRYLLLRHLERLEGLVPRERYLEVTRSLRVAADGRNSYTVGWQDQGDAHEELFPFDTFSFYRRGDTQPKNRSAGDDLATQNDELAQAFAAELFGVAAPSRAARPDEPLEAQLSWSMLEMACVALAIGLLGHFGAVGTIALLALVLVEFSHRGRLISSALFCAVAIAGPPTAALLGATAYALLHLLDPNPEKRIPRVAFCGAAVAVAGVALARTTVALDWGSGAAGALVLAIGIAGARSFYASHFRALPLALPFYCAGLVPDGLAAAAAVGFSILLIGTGVRAAGYRWSPVRRQRGECAF